MEDTTTTTVISSYFGGGTEPPLYVSCIRIDGVPILPPIGGVISGNTMTLEKRSEMRHYRELAVERDRIRNLARDQMIILEESIKSPVSRSPSTTTTASSSTSSTSIPPSSVSVGPFNFGLTALSFSKDKSPRLRATRRSSRKFFPSPEGSASSPPFMSANNSPPPNNPTISASSPAKSTISISSPANSISSPVKSTISISSPVNSISSPVKSTISISSPAKSTMSISSLTSPTRSNNNTSFDFVLSKEVPKSAEKAVHNFLSPADEGDGHSDQSDGSDKENRTKKRKHVRKLSYTLLYPSEALLSATYRVEEPLKQPLQPLEQIESVPSSVGIPSNFTTTPVKNEQQLFSIFNQSQQQKPEPPTPSAGDLDARMVKFQTTLKKLQGLNLGNDKQAHLERFLGEQNSEFSGRESGVPPPGTPTPTVPEQLGKVGLSKLQGKMQLMNSNMFRYPADARSPLLKGLVFPDPLERPDVPLRIPAKALDPGMKPKFDRLTAAVKGYLIRRLLLAEKIQIIIQTVKDTVELLLNLYDESHVTSGGSLTVKPQDEILHSRLLQQLTGACSSFHDVFFKLSIKERMAIIANDREKIRAKALRNVLSRGLPQSPSKKIVSRATLKSIERRLTMGKSPVKDNRAKRIRQTISSGYSKPQPGAQRKSTAYASSNLQPGTKRKSTSSSNPLPGAQRKSTAYTNPHQPGSQTVKSKPSKSYKPFYLK